MKFSKFSELVNRILSNNHSHRRDMDVTIVIHSPGSIGSTPSVEVQSIHAGFDWDSGKVLIFPAQPLPVVPDDNRIQFSVSLPAACGGDKYFIDGVFQPLRYEHDCEKAVVAAGGVVNWVK